MSSRGKSRFGRALSALPIRARRVLLAGPIRPRTFFFVGAAHTRWGNLFPQTPSLRPFGAPHAGAASAVNTPYRDDLNHETHEKREISDQMPVSSDQMSAGGACCARVVRRLLVHPTTSDTKYRRGCGGTSSPTKSGALRGRRLRSRRGGRRVSANGR